MYEPDGSITEGSASFASALHLAGFAHDGATAAEAMEARESELLAALGFGDPYADDG